MKSTRNNTQMAYVMLEDMYASLELIVFSRMLDQVKSLLRAGQVVVVRGKINAKEEEAPTVLVSAVEAAPSPDSVPAPKTPAKPVANPGLYLRLPSLESQEWKRAQKILRVFEGQTPVYLRLNDSGKLMRVPTDLWVTPEAVMIEELQRALGDTNVAKVW